MLIIAGTLTVDPADRSAYLAATVSVAPLARSTPGCLDFVQAADPVEPDRINVYERWSSPEPLLAFRALPAPPDAVEPPPLLGADVRRYVIASVEDP